VFCKERVREIANQYAETVKNALSPDKIILFGSYVNGTPHEWSDIDIAVIMNNFEGEWLKTASLLGKLNRNICIDIEPHLLDETHDPSGFVEHVIKTGEVIYSV